MDSLEFSPGNKLNPPFKKYYQYNIGNIANIKLTHPAPQCLQSLQGSIPLGEISKNFCIGITESTNNAQCLFSPGIYFVCGAAAYTCLPPCWKATCTKALLTPQIDIVPGNQSLPIPLEACIWSKRGIQIIPLLITMGIMTGISPGIGGISSTIYIYQKLSTEFNNDIKQVAQSIEALQDQVDSLTSVVFQNRCALDLLITEKSGTCPFLNEECWFYPNKSGVVRDMIQQLKESVTKRRQELANSWSFWDNLWG
jgi:hypothetical protein